MPHSLPPTNVQLCRRVTDPRSHIGSLRLANRSCLVSVYLTTVERDGARHVDDDFGMDHVPGFRITDWFWLTPVALGGIVVLFTVPTWMVNFDGTSYLALAANLRDFVGYVAPDGSPMTVRGPLYPLVLASSWTFGGYSSGMAMAVSRLVFIGAGMIASGLIFALTRSRVASIGGAAVFFAQPVLMPAGATFFAPDGLAATFVLAAIVLIVAAYQRDRSWLYAMAGVATGLGFVTKESHTLVMFGAVIWLLTRNVPLNKRLRGFGWLGIGFSLGWLPWVVTGINATGSLPGSLPLGGTGASWLVALMIPLVSMASLASARYVPDLRIHVPTAVLATVALVFIVGVTTRFVGDVEGWIAIPNDIRQIISSQAYLGATIIGVAALAAVAVIGVRTIRQRDVADILVVCTVAALGFLPFIVIAKTTIRNAVLLPMLFAVLAGFAIAPSMRERWVRPIAWMLIVISVTSGLVAMARLSDNLDVARRTAEPGATVSAALWLSENAAGDSTAGTPIAYQSIWRLGDRSQDVEIVPIYILSRDSWEEGERTFDRAFGWLGKPWRAPRIGDAVAYSFHGGAVTAVFASDLVDLHGDAKYLVLTGNVRYPESSADGGIVLLALARTDAIRPVFIQTNRNAHWVAIVELVSEPSFDGLDPIVRYSDGDMPSVSGSSIVLDRGQYVAAVKGTLSRMQNELEESKS